MAHVAVMSISLETGGVERQYVRLANQMIAEGHSVDFLLCEKSGPFLTLLDPAISVVDLGNRIPRKTIPALTQYVQSAKPVGVLGGHDAVNIAVVAACRKSHTKTRSVFVAHNTMSARYGRESSDWKSRLRGIAVKWAAKRATVVSAVSAQSADDLALWAGIDRAKIRVPFVPIVGPELLEARNMAPSHPWLIDKTTPVIVSIGRMSAVKQIDLLLEAFVAVSKSSGARLVVFGEGPELPNLKAKRAALGLESAVDFPGTTSSPGSELAAADLLVLSSRLEGLPAVLIEALAMGTPIVSTDCTSGPKEILENGKWGRLVPVGNVEALSAGIIKSLSEPIIPTEDSYQRFTVEASTDAYLSMLLGD